MEKKKEEITDGDSVGFRAQIENVEQILELGAEGSGGERRGAEVSLIRRMASPSEPTDSRLFTASKAAGRGKYQIKKM